MTDHYIHGFSTSEQQRLIRQAEVLSPRLYEGWDLSGAVNVLEIGCAVGAEIKLIRNKWPHVKVTGIDRSASHLDVARRYLEEDIHAGHVELIEGDAMQMPFEDNTFDCVITIWLLEHVNDQKRVLSEAWRVLKPGGQLICTEIDNDTFGVDPRNQFIADWWDRFNRYQEKAGGDPFVGRRLLSRANEIGLPHAEAKEIFPVDSRREPERRGELFEYLKDLLLSGAESMAEASYITEAECKQLEQEFDKAKAIPGSECRYYAVRLRCIKR